MPFSSRAVMLLTLFACLTQSQPINGNAETTTESRGGGGGEADSSNRHYTGRHWTTSLRGPYKKIVSGGDGGRSPRFDASSDDDDDDVTEHEQKRQHRLDSSNSSFVQNTTHDSSAQRVNATKLETVRSRNHRNLASRRSSSYHSVDSTARSTAASNKKRRRPSHYSVATSTAAPSQTMPHAWYSYFRPLEQDLPEDDILPFLDFGRKLSPSLPTPPSGINSIENNKSAGTRSKSKDLHSSNVNINSTPVDEDVLPEDMDVTYVKKAVERNSAPRVTIQTHTPSISNYYRRRHPAALSRTAENLVGTSSDCSSSPSPDRNNSTKTGNQRKTNRQHSNGQTETESGEQSSKCDTSNFEKEVHNSSASLPEKSHRVAENFTAAESSLVNSVKQFETVNLNVTNANNRNITNNVKQNSTTSGRRPGGHPTTAAALRSNKTETNVTAQADNAKTASTSSPNPQLTTRILSTAVVTSVSLKESSFNNSDSPVTAPPSPQSPLPTRLARVVNSTIDTSQVGNSTGDRKNKRPEVHVSGKQSISNFNDTAEHPDRSNSTLVVDTYDKMSANNTTSRETAPPTGSAQTINRSNNTSTVEKTGKQLTNNFNSSGSENRTEQREANRHNSSRNSSNSTSSGSEIRVEPLQVNRGRQTASTVTLSSESGTRTEPPQANQTSRAEKNGKQLVTISNLTTSSDSVVPTESTRPTHTSQTESGYKNLTSDGVIPVVPSPTTGQSNRTTLTTEKSGSNVTADLTPVGKVSFIPVQLTPESTHRSENDGNVSNVTNIDDSVDPLLSSILETTTMTLLQVPALTPVTNGTSLQTNDTKEFPSVTDLPKTDLEIHEERVPGTTGAGNSPSLDEVVANATTTDGSAYVDNNTIADLVPTDVYYDYDEGGLDPLSQPGDKNGTLLVVPEEDVDSWLQNSTVIEQNVEVAYPQPTFESSTYILVGLSIIPILLGAVVAARFFLLRNKKKVLDESEYSSEYNRSPLSISNASPLPTKLPRVPHHLGWEMEKSPPSLSPSLPSSKWEFPREKLRLQTVLGQGNFGQVWKAEADDISGHEGLTRLVAVKTVKESASAREREDLLRELGIMQDLGSHPNVVTLLGCCTEKEPYYLIMEYVMYGKLLTFLRDHRTRAHYYNFSDVTDALTSRDLTVFMYCVARGMDYLSNKGIIHRDLAARNVLVDHNKLCKIADFGMSRNVRDTGQIYEQRQSKGALPIRWMAPESLHFSLFTHKSDVWSFGILLWEIITLGSTPYATMGAREVMRRVRDGYRLERPSHCRPELFRVISRCWHADSNKRPNFAELKHEIGQLLSDMERGGNYIDLDSLHEEMKQSSQGSTLQRNQ